METADLSTESPDTGGSTEGLTTWKTVGAIVGPIAAILTIICLLTKFGKALYRFLQKKCRKGMCCLKLCQGNQSDKNTILLQDDTGSKMNSLLRETTRQAEMSNHQQELVPGNLSDQDTTTTENVVELSAGQPSDAEGDSLLRETIHQQGAPTHQRDDSTNQQRETKNQQSIPTHQAEKSNQQQELPPGASYVRDRGDNVSSACSGASDVTDRGDNVASACSGASDVTDRGDNVASACSDCDQLMLWKISECLNTRQVQKLGVKLGVPPPKLENLRDKVQKRLCSQEEMNFEMLYIWNADQTPDDDPWAQLQQILVTDLNFSEMSIEEMLMKESLLHQSTEKRVLGRQQLLQIAENADKSQVIPLVLRMGLTFNDIRHLSGKDPIDLLFTLLMKWQRELPHKTDQIKTMSNILAASGQKNLAYRIGKNHWGVINGDKKRSMTFGTETPDELAKFCDKDLNVTSSNPANIKQMSSKLLSMLDRCEPETKLLIHGEACAVGEVKEKIKRILDECRDTSRFLTRIQEAVTMKGMYHLEGFTVRSIILHVRVYSEEGLKKLMEDIHSGDIGRRLAKVLMMKETDASISDDAIPDIRLEPGTIDQISQQTSVNYKSVSMAPTQSRVLSDDLLIHQVATTDIDAPAYYGRLGLALLGNQAEVANILGRPIPQFEEAMYQCLITFCNAKGRGWKESMMKIFEEMKLSDALALLKEGRPEDVSRDQFLYQLVEEIDCLSYYTELGTRLLNSSAQAQYKLGPVTPSYTLALHKCMIKWRGRNGATTDAYTKFRGILMSQGLVSQAENMDKLERAGLGTYEVDLSRLPTPPNDMTRPEPEACLVTDTSCKMESKLREMQI